MRPSFLGRDLRERLGRDVAALGVPPAPGPALAESQLAALPSTVRRYLDFMGVVGRPAVTAFRAHLSAKFRLRPGQRFMPAEIWQYNSVDPIVRLFWMRIDASRGLTPMVGRDSYVAGRGHLRGRLFDTFVVAEGCGEPFDIGELTTWLNDAVMMAPAMLLAAGAKFQDLDDHSFEVVLTDRGHRVAAVVTLDDRGAPVDFRSEDRYADLPGGPVRTLWSTPISGWQRVDGRAYPTRGSGVWHLPEGEFVYGVLEFAPDAVEPNPTRADAPAPAPSGGGVLAAAGGAAAIAATLVGSPLLRRRYNRWGATDAEVGAALPGDELVPDPRLVSTRAITIDAPADAVWPWLVQIGQGRGGLYSYDALENLVGLDIHSAAEILPGRSLAPGDLVRLGKPGSPCFQVIAVEPGRSLVTLSADPVTERAVSVPVRVGPGQSWQWLLRPMRNGAATRLISRQRNVHPAKQRLLWRLVEPVGFVMERRMLLGIKERAEHGRLPGR